jgi:hypothetical protein
MPDVDENRMLITTNKMISFPPMNDSFLGKEIMFDSSRYSYLSKGISSNQVVT